METHVHLFLQDLKHSQDSSFFVTFNVYVSDRLCVKLGIFYFKILKSLQLKTRPK